MVSGWAGCFARHDRRSLFLPLVGLAMALCASTKPTNIDMMNLKQTLYGVGILVMLAGCSSTNDVVSKGPFQKRKYQKGWHVDLNTGKRSETAQAQKVAEKAWSEAEERTETAQAMQEVVPMAAAGVTLPMEQIPVVLQRVVTQKVEEEVTASAELVLYDKPQTVMDRLSPQSEARPSLPPAAPEGENDRTNGMAIAGFVCSLFIPILGLIFSAIALGQIKRRGGRGKGLATAGLVISIVTILLLIALL